MEYKYRLTFSGKKDTVMLRSNIKHLGVFPLFKDSDAKLINYNEYMYLVERKEIYKPYSYWQIEKNEVGLVSLDSYTHYSSTWDLVLSAFSDFQAGWLACNKVSLNK